MERRSKARSKPLVGSVQEKLVAACSNPAKTRETLSSRLSRSRCLLAQASANNSIAAMPPLKNITLE